MSSTDFIIENGVLVKYTGAGGHVVIPDSVKVIGDHAFSECKSLESVIIPDSVRTIGNWAFGNCHSLAYVAMGKWVETIGYWAFGACFRLKNIKIPDSMQSIGEYAFSWSGLESVEFEEDIQIRDFNCQTFFHCSNLAKIDIPDSIVEIASETFAECESLETVNFGKKSLLTIIGDGAFRECISLKSIEIPNGVRIIDEEAFLGCESLENINIPNSVISINDCAFSGCESLANITIPDSVDELGIWAFADCSNATISAPASLKSTEGIESLGLSPFKECKKVIYRKSNKDLPNVPPLQGDKYVFISYSSKNKDYAEAMLQLLKDEKIYTWMAPYDIPAGSKYAHVIHDAIQKCSCVLLLLSEQSQASEWVDKEIERAINYKKTVISMHLDECPLNNGFSFYLANQQIVPVKVIKRNDPNVQKVIDAIKSFVR